MFTLASRIHFSNNVRILLGILCFCFIVWIFFNILDYENHPDLQPQDRAGQIDGGVAYGPLPPVKQKPAVEKVKVAVYYECLCPDSKYFVTSQLYSTWKEIGEIMDVQFVPYGKATTSKTKHGYTFECQHGTEECKGDIIHCCAAKILDSETSMEYINCMMKQREFDTNKIAQDCAAELGIDWPKIEGCAIGREGEELHAEAGILTNKIQPPVSFIPTIELDYSQRSQKAMLKNFVLEVCKVFLEKTGKKGPQGCVNIL